MADEAPIPRNEGLDSYVARVKEGDRRALESVVRAVLPDVYGLAQRFLWHPQDAEDATQEILIRVIKGLPGFRGDCALRTWVHRIACNTLLTLRKKRVERQGLSFEAFGEDLDRGLSDSFRVEYDVDQALLLEEVKVGCTLGMLMCLDRDHRLAYILGEILELSHQEAAEVLEIQPATYRKRLSRARQAITLFMTGRCGLVNPSNACRCRRRVATAMDLGRVDPRNLLFATSVDRARRFPEVVNRIRLLEQTQRAAALYKSHQAPQPPESFVPWLQTVLDEAEG